MHEIISILKSGNIFLEPMTDREIAAMEIAEGVSFPDVYKQFLTAMGKGAGRYMLGSDMFYPEIQELKEAAEELILENNLPKLPQNAFVFWMHQGYQMAFFLTDEGDNPTVFYFSEGEAGGYTKKQSLLDFLKDQLILSGLSGL